MVSIIIPNYNNRDYLPQCLDSVLNQTYADFEIVVVDDCSTDGSQETLREFEARHPNVVVLFNEENLGVVKTRDRGIRAARGPYITTLDADDYYFAPTKLEKEMELLWQYQQEHQEQVMPFSNVVYVDQEGRFVKRDIDQDNLKEGWIFNTLLLRKCAVPRDFIFLKEHYFQVQGFDPAIPVYEDWDLKLRLSRLGRFVYTFNDGVAYRQTSAGLSSVSILKHVKWKNYVFNKNVSELGKWSQRMKSSIVFKTKLLRELLGGLKNQLLYGLSRP
jgi:glycosyltransferase involved in cell wall biosynthesis